MAGRNLWFPGQKITKTYTTQAEYEEDAKKLAAQGWSVRLLIRNDVASWLNRPAITVTYDYRPTVNAGTPLPARSVTPPPSPSMAPSATPDSLYLYPIWEAILVASLLVLGLALSFAEVGIGPSMLVAGVIYASIRDGQGLLSMRNLFKWSAMSGAGKTWVVVALVFLFEVFLPFYAVRILIDAFRSPRKAAQRAQLELQQRTAELESQLGILPSVQGECRKCQKPLQVGAEYCAYCGEPVVLRPRICPVCASTALPDAKFCPKCRAELPQTI